MLSAEAIEWLSKLGVIGLLALMYYNERNSRVAAEARADKERSLNESLTRETVASAIKTEAAIASMLTVLTGRKAD